MEKFKGIVKNFNKKYGFIAFEKGDAYFHESSIVPQVLPEIEKGATVEFIAKPSEKRQGIWEVVSLYNAIGVSRSPFLDSATHIGTVKFFDEIRGFGFLQNQQGDYFVHESKLQNTFFLDEGDICMFHIQPSTKKEGSYEACGVFLLNNKSVNSDVLEKYFEIIGIIDSDTKYEQVKKVYALLPQENQADFIQKAYELADEERKYQILQLYTVPELEMNFVQNLFLEKQQNFDYEVIRHLAQGYQSEFTTFFLNHLQSIDSGTKYQQVKKVYTLLHQENRADFIQKAYELADKERKYQILQLYTVPELEMNFVQNIFLEKQQNFDYEVIRHLAQGYQSEFTTFFLNYLQSIDSGTKYEQVKKVYASIHQENRADFIQKAYELADKERKYQILQLYTVPELEMNFVQNLFLEKQQNFDYEVIRHLAQGYQSEFTTFFLNHLQSIDSDTKYEQVKKVYALLHQENRADFVQKAYELADEERKFQLWLEDYTKEIDVSYIPKEMVKISSFDSWSNPYERIFEKLSDEKKQQLAFAFLDHLQSIDSDTKYEQVKKVYASLHQKKRSDFIQKAYELADEERKFQLWLEDYTKETDVSYILKGMANIRSFGIWSNPYERIFEKLSDEKKQQVAFAFLGHLQSIDSDTKYEQVRKVYALLHQENRADFIQKAYELADEERKFQLWLEDYTKETDVSHISKGMANISSFDSWSNPYKRIFKKLSSEKKQQVAFAFLGHLQSIDSDTKYEQVKKVYASLHQKKQSDFIQKAYELADEERKFQLWLEDYTKETDVSYIPILAHSIVGVILTKESLKN
jgi:cold shock CspA family protein/head-tail adaptor